jgi:site-specific DNA-cytosine methylase
MNNDGAKTLDQPSYTIRGHGTRHGILIVDDHHQRGSNKDLPRITDVTNSPAPTVDAREGGRSYLAILDEPATTIWADPRMLPRGHHAKRNYPMFRRLTPGECSILQGFPKSFIWKPKTKTSHYQMIGNAVPPPVSRAIAEALNNG